MGRENARPIGITRVVGEVLALGMILGMVRGPRQLWVVPVAQLTGETFVVAVLYLLLVRAGFLVHLRWDLATALPVFRRAVPLVAQIVLGLVLYNCDLVFLRFMADTGDVGYYAAAYTLISFLANVSIAYGTSLLPTLTRLGSGTDSELALYHTALADTFALSLPISIGGCFLAGTIIRSAFGPGYAPGGPVLQILVWAVPLSAVRTVAWATLVARGQHGLLLRATIYTVGANLFLNVLLIHLFGMMGAALSTVLTELIVAMWMLYYATGQGLTRIPLGRLLRPIIAGVMMAFALAALAGGAPALRSALAVGVYGCTLLVVGGIRWRSGALPMLDL